jgi:hypothetical protein
MPEQTKYICSNCGQEHDEWPALTYSAPVYYNQLTEEEKLGNAELGSDICIIHNPEQTDRFIRCTMTQKVTDHCDDLEYGLWVSLSEESFEDYLDNFENDDHVMSYFGWLSNQLPGYEDMTQIPTTVFTRTGGRRPYIVPHEDFDHPFVRDFYNGITKQEAERRIAEQSN